MTNYSERLVSFIWDVADLLRGPYRPPEYRKVMLPMTVLRRLDCVLEPSKSKVLEEHKRLKGQSPAYTHKMLQRAARHQFYNTSKYHFERLKGDPAIELLAGESVRGLAIAQGIAANPPFGVKWESEEDSVRGT